ncbi:MAG: acyloxyacyl hydrolase [Pseudomonadota bacterium]
MKTAIHHSRLRRYKQGALFLALSLVVWCANRADAQDQTGAAVGYRILAAGDKFDGVQQYAVTYDTRAPRRLRSRHLEFAAGQLVSKTSDRLFVSVGPVWRVPIVGESVFVDLGFSWTFVGGSELSDRDLGGNVHFTSSVAIGMALGRKRSIVVSLRAQHTSNGGLSRTNPGLDMIGINLAFNFADR